MTPPDRPRERFGTTLKDARPICFGACISMLILASSMITYGDQTFSLEGVMVTAAYWAIAFCVVHSVIRVGGFLGKWSP